LLADRALKPNFSKNLYGKGIGVGGYNAPGLPHSLIKQVFKQNNFKFSSGTNTCVIGYEEFASSFKRSRIVKGIGKLHAIFRTDLGAKIKGVGIMGCYRKKIIRIKNALMLATNKILSV
jgi:hypothetical protein